MTTSVEVEVQGPGPKADGVVWQGEGSVSGNDELHVVFGAGPLGLAVMRQLLARGKRTWVVSSSGKVAVPSQVQVLRSDATDAASIAEICRWGAVIYNCAEVYFLDWEEYLPRIQAGLVEGAALGGGKIVSAESTIIYGRVDGPVSEDLALAPTTRKGRIRARLVKSLLDAHESGKVRATIGVSSDLYGPEVLSSAMGEPVFRSLVGLKKVWVAGKLDVPHTYTFIDDFAKGLVTLGEKDEALGEVWHIPSAETVTTGQFLDLASKEAQAAYNVGTIPSLFWKIAGIVDPMVGETAAEAYRFENPFVVSHGKYERAFGNETTAHEVALRRTIEWFRGYVKQG